MLSAITADAAAESVFPLARVTKTAGHTQSVRDMLVAAAQSGQLSPSYVPGTQDCKGAAGSIRPAVMTAIGTTALKIAPMTGPAAPFVFAAGLVTDVVGFIGGIFTHHHQQAVAKERGTLCVEVPAANNALQAIDAAVQAGQLTPAQAQQGLDAVVQQFKSNVAAIMKGTDPASSGACNAACVMLAELRAAVSYKKSVYADMASASAAPFSVSTLTASTGLPPWALYAAAGLVLWKLL
jgi:hypothetical protein